MTARSQRAREHATRASFFMPGFAIAAWAPLVPFAKARTGLDDAQLGLVLLCLGSGPMLAMPLTGSVAGRRGCRQVLALTTLLGCALLPTLALVNSPALLGLALFVLGAAFGLMDCTINLQAAIVERDSGRAMMSGFHAFYSIGSLLGAVATSALFSLGLPPWLGCLPIVAIVLVMLALAWPHWLADRLSGDSAVFVRPRGVVLALGLLCFVAFLAEGAMLDWSAVFLHEQLGADARQAGWGYAMFAATMTLMRLIGDRVVRRLGQARTVTASAVVAALGLLLAALSAHWTLALAGFAIAGLGYANIIPIMFSMAGRQHSMPGNLAIPAVATFGYAGILVGPALIGALAHATSLMVALLAVSGGLMLVGSGVRKLAP